VRFRGLLRFATAESGDLQGMPRQGAPRSLWTGPISFGLVNVPVKIYTAVHEHKLRFHLVHEKDDGAIGYEKVCKLEEKPVPDDKIVKAFEVSKGKLVHLADEDFEAAQVESGARTIELEDSSRTTRSTRPSSHTPTWSGRRTAPSAPTRCS
jgi:Ku70/Ku80 beta-barrel domain